MTKQINNHVSVVKSLNEELKQATFLVLAPDDVDLHEDTYSAEEVRKACHNYNLNCNKANLYHVLQTDMFDVVESYITPVELNFGEQIIKAGSWIAVVQVNEDDLWSGIKDGSVCGISVGCKADVEYIEDTE